MPMTYDKKDTVLELKQELRTAEDNLIAEFAAHGKTLARMHRTEELYQELLHAVARKFSGESRHETALRYIRDTESALVNPDQIIGDRDMSNESKPEPEVR